MGYFKSNSLNLPINVVNIEPFSPLFDRVVIKVMYAGMNRNGSYFDKEAVEYLAKSLPNTPLVGTYDKGKKDFKGHEQTIGFSGDKLTMISSTVPYGVVPADTEIWWEWFKDQDGVEREYLCCHGLVWTTRFPEIKQVIMNGTSNQSMELDEDTITGSWVVEKNTQQKFFYVKESYLLGLCILGEKNQPCFEGAQLSKPVNFSAKDDSFDTMLEELKVALNFEISKKLEGSKKMDATEIILENEVKEEPIITDANFAKKDEEEENPFAPKEEEETTEEEEASTEETPVEEEAEEDVVEEDEEKKPPFFNEEEEQSQPQEEGSAAPLPQDPEMRAALLEKRLEVASQSAELEVLEEFVKEEAANPIQQPVAVEETVIEEDMEKKPEEEEEPLENPLAEDNIPRPGLQPKERIEDAEERSEAPIATEEPKEEEPVVEQPVEEEEEEKKKPPFLQNEAAPAVAAVAGSGDYQKDLSDAYAYIQQLEMELKPLREMKTRQEMQEKMTLMHEFKDTYGDDVETTFADKLSELSIEQFKVQLGLYAFEHRENKKESKIETPIVSFSVKAEDNRPDFLKALDAALGR